MPVRAYPRTTISSLLRRRSIIHTASFSRLDLEVLVWALRVLFFFVLLIGSISAKSQSLEACQMKIPFAIPAEEEDADLSGAMKIEINTFQGINIPYIGLELDSDLDMSSMKVIATWRDVDLLRSSGKPFFSDNYYELAKTISEDTFVLNDPEQKTTSSFWGFAKSQVFFSLLHSQNSVHLEVQEANGALLFQADVSLSGNDVKFRRLANSCFPNLAADYLEGDNRKQGIGISWRNSYGVFDYSNIASISNNVYLHDLTKYKPASALLAITELLELSEQGIEINASVDWLDEEDALEKMASELKELRDRILSLSGAKGEIPNAISLEASQALKLQQLEQQRLELAGKLRPLQSVFSLKSAEFNVLSTELSSMSALIDNARGAIISLRQDIKRLEEFSLSPVVRDYVQISEEYKGVEDTSLAPDLAAIVSMGTELRENRDRNSKAGEYRQLIDVVFRALDQMNLFTEIIQSEHAAIQEKSASLVKMRSEVSRLAEYKHLVTEQLFGLNHSSLIARLRSEPQAETFSQDSLVKRLKSSYAAYENLVESAAKSLGDYAPLVELALCNTDSFQRRFTGNCLNPFDLQNAQAVSSWISRLSSAQLNDLKQLLTETDDLFNSKTVDQDLLTDWSVFLVQLPMLELQQAWEEMLYSRWLIFKARDLKFENVSTEALLEVAFEIDSELRSTETKIATLKEEMTALSAAQGFEQSQFVLRQRDYFEKMGELTLQVQTEIDQQYVQFFETQNLNCFKTELVPLLCKDQTRAQLDFLTQLEESLLVELRDLETSLNTGVNQLYQSLLSDKTNNENRLAALEEEKSDFLSTHDIVGKQRELSFLNQRVTSLNQMSSSLSTEAKYQREQKAATVMRIADYRAELLSLKQMEASLQTVWDENAQQSQAYCQRFNDLRVTFNDLKARAMRSFELMLDEPESIMQGNQLCSVFLETKQN